MPCVLCCYETSSEINVLWLSRVEIAMGRTFPEHILRVFSVMAGWIAEMLFMLFFAYIAM